MKIFVKLLNTLEQAFAFELVSGFMVGLESYFMSLHPSLLQQYISYISPKIVKFCCSQTGTHSLDTEI
jgi:hypothetical protein